MSPSPRLTDEQRLAEIDAALRPLGAQAAVPEVPVARLRRSGVVLLVPALLLIAGAFGVVYLPLRFGMPWGVVGGIGCAVVILLGSVYPLLLWLASAYTVTTRRIILRRGVFVRVRREVSFGRIRDVAVRRNPVQLASGSGDVELVLQDDPPVVLRSVPRPATVFAALQELAERSFAATDSVGPGLRRGTGMAPRSPLGGPAPAGAASGGVPAPAPARPASAAGFHDPTDPGFTTIISGR